MAGVTENQAPNIFDYFEEFSCPPPRMVGVHLRLLDARATAIIGFPMIALKQAPISHLKRFAASGLFLIAAGTILIAAGVFADSSSNPSKTVLPASTSRENEEPNYFVQELPPVIADEAEFVSTTFPVRNDKNHAITFHPIRLACSCQDAELGKQILQPSESTTLKMGLKTSGRSGRQKITCMIDEVDGETRRIRDGDGGMPVSGKMVLGPET